MADTEAQTRARQINADFARAEGSGARRTLVVENYRAQVEALVRRLADEHPALAKLERAEPLTDEDLEQIATTLSQADLFVTTDTLRQACDAPQATLTQLLRHIVDEDSALPALAHTSRSSAPTESRI
jgi:type I site-specific restriction endonuclease